MTDNDNYIEAQQAYAQAQAYGRDLARLYALEKERRNELERTSQKLQAIFDTVPTGLAVVDNSLTIVEANPRFLALFEQTAECIGQPLATLLPVEALVKSMASAATDVYKSGSVEIEVAKPVSRTLLINLSPLGNSQDWVLVFYDLTERQRLEGLKNEFINIAAHELRTPLAGVMGFVSVLKEDLKDSDNPMAQEIMGLILQSTERLKGIIDELVEFAAAQRGTTESLNITEISLNQLFHQSLRVLQQQIEAKGLLYRLELPDDPLIVRGDHLILTEVIYHLLDNAVKFNKPQGQIIIRVHDLPSASPSTEKFGQNGVFIEIEDTGIGIPQTELDRIFDKFYQVEEHLIRAVGGLGLGLTIARRGIQRHGGQMWVSSQLGKGSIFRVMLPAISEPSNVSIDNRLDVIHQQMLLYAQDMARAVTSQRKLSKKLEQIKDLVLNLAEELGQLSVVQLDTKAYTTTFDQTRKLVQKLIKLSE
ncbi:MAG TPA: ATP-binding protein [Anaerolineae bacterium]|nr:ATP-binding protein [Anaerolineae bacterium]